ncbi:hypothetical protein CB1_000349024 [Camelus ferus]|nr:hypothetical protein CB1_000349024 [Camelus ferus]
MDNSGLHQQPAEQYEGKADSGHWLCSLGVFAQVGDGRILYPLSCGWRSNYMRSDLQKAKHGPPPPQVLGERQPPNSHRGRQDFKHHHMFKISHSASSKSSGPLLVHVRDYDELVTEQIV